MTKSDLRDRIKKKKHAMTGAEIEEKSTRLARLFLESEPYQKANTIYGYLAFNQEVRTLPILEQALRDGKQVAIAKCYGKDMRFIQMEDLRQIQTKSFGLPEPIADEPVAQDEHALVLLPGLAFDRNGYRIGYGGGYYDRFLSREPDHPTVALCFDFQILDHLPVEEFDIPAQLLLWA